MSYKHRKEVATDLKPIYRAMTIDEAEMALEAFSKKWDTQYASISRMWLERWGNVTPFFAYPPEIRKVIYTTNAIESLNMTLRKVTKNRRFFPSDDAVFKQLYLSLQNIMQKWTMPIHDWGSAMNRFNIEFSERMPQR